MNGEAASFPDATEESSEWVTAIGGEEPSSDPVLVQTRTRLSGPVLVRTKFCVASPEDSVTFWRSIKEAGLLEEVVEDFQKELQEVLKGLQERVCDPPLQVKGQNHTLMVQFVSVLDDCKMFCGSGFRCGSAQQHCAELRDAGPGEEGSGQSQEPDGPVPRAVLSQPRWSVPEPLIRVPP